MHCICLYKIGQGIKKEIDRGFTFPEAIPLRVTMSDLLEPRDAKLVETGEPSYKNKGAWSNVVFINWAIRRKGEDPQQTT